MGYEMYRLLNYASDTNVKIPPKKTTKTMGNSDDDSSGSSEKGWRKKNTKSKTDLANIEKYRMRIILHLSTER